MAGKCFSTDFQQLISEFLHSAREILSYYVCVCVCFLCRIGVANQKLGTRGVVYTDRLARYFFCAPIFIGIVPTKLGGNFIVK